MKDKLLIYLADRIKEEASSAEDYVQEIGDEAQADKHLAKMAAFQEIEQYVKENL